MSKRNMVKERNWAGVELRDKIGNKQCGKFVQYHWMLKTFKQEILNKDAVNSLKMGDMNQQYKQFYMKEGVLKMIIDHEKSVLFSDWLK